MGQLLVCQAGGVACEGEVAAGAEEVKCEAKSRCGLPSFWSAHTFNGRGKRTFRNVVLRVTFRATLMFLHYIRHTTPESRTQLPVTETAAQCRSSSRASTMTTASTKVLDTYVEPITMVVPHPRMLIHRLTRISHRTARKQSRHVGTRQLFVLQRVGQSINRWTRIDRRTRTFRKWLPLPRISQSRFKSAREGK